MPIDHLTHLPHSATMATWLVALQLDITRQEESTNVFFCCSHTLKTMISPCLCLPRIPVTHYMKKVILRSSGLFIVCAEMLIRKKLQTDHASSLMLYVIRIHTHNLTLSFRLYSQLGFCGEEDSHGCHKGSYNNHSKHWSKHMVSTSLHTHTHTHWLHISYVLHSRYSQHNMIIGD